MAHNLKSAWSIVGRLGCLLAIAALSVSAAADVQPAAPSSASSEYVLRILRPRVPIPIEDACLTMPLGTKLPLVQQNEEFFIVLVQGGYRGPRLCAFPLMKSRESRTGWVTFESELILAYRTTTCPGVFYLRGGEEFPVIGSVSTNWEVAVTVDGVQASLLIPKDIPDIEYAKAPPPPPPEPAIREAQASAKPTQPKRRTRRPAAVAATHGREAETADESAAALATMDDYSDSALIEDPPLELFQVGPLDPPDPKDKGFIERISSYFASIKIFSGSRKPKPAEPSKETVEAEAPPPAMPVAGTNETVEVAASPPSNVVSDEADAASDNRGGILRDIWKNITISQILLVLMLPVAAVYARQQKRTTRSVAEPETQDVEVPQEDPQAPVPDFSGSIDSTTLGALAQWLNSEMETGTLTLKEKRGGVLGQMVLVKGEIIDAVAGNKRGENAVHALLKQKQGNFSFVREEHDQHEKTVEQSTMSLVLDAYREMDEASDANNG